jgi:hypothetical protein
MDLGSRLMSSSFSPLTWLPIRHLGIALRHSTRSGGSVAGNLGRLQRKPETGVGEPTVEKTDPSWRLEPWG